MNDFVKTFEAKEAEKKALRVKKKGLDAVVEKIEAEEAEAKLEEKE